MPEGGRTHLGFGFVSECYAFKLEIDANKSGWLKLRMNTERDYIM